LRYISLIASEKRWRSSVDETNGMTEAVGSMLSEGGEEEEAKKFTVSAEETTRRAVPDQRG
jgi:hypothetical protein